MEKNNQVIIERDMYCPYCENNAAVLISESVKTKTTLGYAAIGLKNGCLFLVTGGCWALINGIPLFDVKHERTTQLYGFCPCCGNTYPVIKPAIEEKTVIDKLQDTKDGFTHLAGQAKDFINKN